MITFFTIAVMGFCLATLLALAHGVLSVLREPARMTPRVQAASASPSADLALVPVVDQREQAVAYVGVDRRQSALKPRVTPTDRSRAA